MSQVDIALAEAQAERQRLIENRVDNAMKIVLLGPTGAGKAPGVSQASTVGPAARHKLRGILRHYAKEAHPFTACVRDNRKRFGPRAEAVCAVVKDIIRGTTRWRGHPALDHGAPGALAASETSTMIMELDQDSFDLLMNTVNDSNALEELCAALEAEEVTDDAGN